MQSAVTLRIALPLAPAELGERLLAVASRNGMADQSAAYLRIVVTRGAGPMGINQRTRSGRPSPSSPSTSTGAARDRGADVAIMRDQHGFVAGGT